VPFRIFKSRALSVANGVMVLVGGVFFAMWYFLTYYFQFVLGYGPLRAGFAFVPMAIAIILGRPNLVSSDHQDRGATRSSKIGADARDNWASSGSR
jgi:hypothetical protein